MTDNKSIAICIAGWHYSFETLYATATSISKAEVFVISHKPPDQVPKWIFDYVKPEKVFFEKNLGYDWGAYQQFLAKQLWRQFEYTVFMHDDLLIKDVGFINRCVELFNQGNCVVGNARVSEIRSWPARVYAHSTWKPRYRDFKHDAVRGSFFAVTKKALETLESFEVFWDPFHVAIGFGNCSTLATCGKWQELCGEKCFGFLSETYCESEYIVELVRGGEGISKIKSPIKKYCVIIVSWLFDLYMSMYWNKKDAYLVYPLSFVIRLLLITLSGIPIKKYKLL